jgi:hypothetical protein
MDDKNRSWRCAEYNQRAQKVTARTREQLARLVGPKIAPYLSLGDNRPLENSVSLLVSDRSLSCSFRSRTYCVTVEYFVFNTVLSRIDLPAKTTV